MNALTFRVAFLLLMYFTIDIKKYASFRVARFESFRKKSSDRIFADIIRLRRPSVFFTIPIELIRSIGISRPFDTYLQKHSFSTRTTIQLCKKPSKISIFKTAIL